MLADPQTIVYNTAPQSLPRVAVDATSAAYQDATGTFRLINSHAVGKRVRTSFRLQTQQISPDPLTPAINKPSSMSVTLVIDAPLNGYSLALQKVLVDTLTEYLTQASGAVVTKVLGGES